MKSRKPIDALGPRQFRNRLNQLFPRDEDNNGVAMNNPNEDLSNPSIEHFANNEGQSANEDMISSNNLVPELGADSIIEMLVNNNMVNDHVLVGELLDIEGAELTNEEANLFEMSDSEDSDEEESARRNLNLNENMPLYFGADITVKESMLSILSLVLKNNIPMTTVADIITVIEMHCLKPGLIKNSVHKFQKFFNLTEPNYKKYYYCSFCQKKFENENEECDSCHIKKTLHFIELPIIRHLQSMFRREDFFNSLQKRFENQSRNNLIRDVYDGQLYKDAYDSGFLAKKENISFTWYTDGIPVFLSSKISAWPVYLTINELPFEERKKRWNTLILGLWFGENKPHFNHFIYSFRETLEKIFSGIKIELPHGDKIIMRGVLLMGVCDLPAKSECLNFKQYNGEYGCPVCFYSGASIQTGPRSFYQVFPYTNEFQMRSAERCIELAEIATSNNPQYGVKGHTAFSQLMPDFIRGIHIDRMHAVDSGVVKKLLTLIFDSEYKSFSFSLYNSIEIVNYRLKKIKPPKFIHRMPRTVHDLIHWKSSEFRHFLFYYSIPIFDGIMKQEYFDHYLRFFIAISILSSDEITSGMIDVAEDLLNRFVREFQDLYNVKYCSMNIHLLLYLANSVREHGPLWAYTCYEYENINGEILKLIHGTRYIDSQVANAHNHLLSMVSDIENINNNNVREFCLNKKKQVRIIEQICLDGYSVGKYKLVENIPDIILIALNNSGIETNNVLVWAFIRLLKNNNLYVAKEYTKSIQTISYAIKFKENGEKKMGLIHSFIKYLHCSCNRDECNCDFQYYALVYDVMSNGVWVAEGRMFKYDSKEFIHSCNEFHRLRAIPIENIIKQCIYMEINDKKYFAIPVNTKEIE